MDHFHTQRQRLHSLFGVFFSPEVTAALLELARPALALGAEGEATVRLGGAPVLPVGEEWPVVAGRPLDFLGAVDFGEIAALGAVPWLPDKGVAAFYGGAGCRVFAGEMREAERPEGASAYPSCPLGAKPFLSVPSPQEPALRRLEAAYSGCLPLYEQLHAAWAQHAWPDDAPMHQIGGWPVLTRDPEGPQATESGWRLLLQLDSDNRLGWDWGGSGRVYFCVQENAPVDSACLTAQAAEGQRRRATNA
ncbi:DUF1963 domain-containing protein [Actinomadura kijaniata]|uniref:DUF1963 domain-containing protein n=1 Tax=Actinomadura kijaniata TaxID=46161 RepID=UPI000834D50A|nr:YwqG family protein [Actinomadura kijaniata]